MPPSEAAVWPKPTRLPLKVPQRQRSPLPTEDSLFATIPRMSRCKRKSRLIVLQQAKAAPTAGISIDNLTGTNIDLLTTPSYTFEGKTTDYASRFRLVFSASGDADDAPFAFIDADGNLVVLGEGTLQVFDILGHQLYAKQVSLTTNLSTLTTPGVYVLRLINGENVRTQKIVVR